MRLRTIGHSDVPLRYLRLPYLTFPLLCGFICYTAVWGFPVLSPAEQANSSSDTPERVYWSEHFTLSALRQTVTGNPKFSLIRPATSAANSALTDFLKRQPGWLKRIEFEADITENLKPEFSILTVQPLYQPKDLLNTFFTQGRFAYGRNDRKTFNIGLGFRRLIFQERVMLGINTFFDYEAPFDHRRVGVGAEVRSLPLELNANYYDGISGERSARGNSIERALDGYDLEAGMQLPYIPWARVFGKYFYFETVARAKNIHGGRVSLRLRPLPITEVEVGWVKDNFNKGAAFVNIRLSFGLGRTEQDSGVAKIDDQPFRFESMKDLTLDKVRRENTIRVEQFDRSSGGTISVVVSRST